MLLTRAPLVLTRKLSPFDLHVLGTPPAFVLSQNQTLQFKFCTQQIADFLYVTEIIVCWFVFSNNCDIDQSPKRRLFVENPKTYILAIQFSKSEILRESSFIQRAFLRQHIFIKIFAIFLSPQTS